MARSLTVKHDEAPATSPLFTGFLVLAVGWMLMSTLAASTADAGVAAGADDFASIFEE